MESKKQNKQNRNRFIYTGNCQLPEGVGVGGGAGR